VRFEPGIPVEVTLVPMAGDRVAQGFSGVVNGPLDANGALEAALAMQHEG
jgi:urease subunit gamma/beta